MRSDVVVIGGGPAGLATALELAQAGLNVVICERQKFPIDKPCGEGIMPEGVHHLHRLGVMAHLDQSQMSRMEGVCLINRSGAQARSSFEPLYGLGVRRLALSQALYARAREYPQITIMPSTPVLGMAQKDSFVSLKTAEASLLTRFVVGADGLRSAVRKWALLEQKGRSFQRYGLRQHFRIKPWSRFVEVYFAPGLEAYITPCGPEQTNITLLWSKNPNLKPTFQDLLKKFPTLCERVIGAEPLSHEQATGPLQHRCAGPIADGVALVGDASGYLDAITGEGNSIAMSQAQALAHTLVKALGSSKGLITKEQLTPYARAHRIIVSHYYRNTGLMLSMARFPKLMDYFIDWGAKNPRAFSWVIARSRGSARTALLNWPANCHTSD